ncbi:MAG: hypothetical protein JXR56_09975, partial [Candidatus Cloacimonetes bacterium]|nr:hypothetical protein [Candidatus Cloacimonadota bacterium]
MSIFWVWMIVLMSLFLTSFLFAGESIELTGDFIQGGLVRAVTNLPVQSVMLDGDYILHADTTFVFGFDLDAPLHHSLTIALIGGNKLQYNFMIDDYNQGE